MADAAANARLKKAQAHTQELANKLMNVTEMAKALGLSERRVRVFCTEGRLGVAIGPKCWVASREEVAEFKKVPRTSGNPEWAKDE